jgi:peptide/nickel transport system permease protein
VLQYILKRFLIMIPTVLLISLITFWIIQLPPGDYMTTYAAMAAREGEIVDDQFMEELRTEYGFNQPFFVQYGKWMVKLVTKGDLGISFQWKKQNSVLINERMGMTLLISITSLLFTYALSIPIGIYSATHQYSFGDYLATFIGFLGMATPNFLLGIILMYFSYKWYGVLLMGLFSPDFVEAAWSWARFLDLLKHMIIPVIVIGTAGTCSLIRVMRGQLLDELRKQYVITARAKGVGASRLLFKYPVRAAVNPIVSTVGWSLAGIFSGSTIAAIVLNLQTQGTLLYSALLNQDMYLAGALLFILTILTVIGTLVSDLLLLWLDPRIRYGKAEN